MYNRLQKFRYLTCLKDVIKNNLSTKGNTAERLGPESRNGDFIQIDLLKSKHFSKQHDSAGVVQVHETWLRHHCRCEICYNRTTLQRQIKLNNTLLEAKITNVHLTETHQIVCTWNDNHKSCFDLDWLIQSVPKFNGGWQNDSRERGLTKFIPPSSPSLHTRTHSDPMSIGLEFDNLMQNESAVKQFIENIVTLGFGIILNAPKTADATLEAVQRIAHQQRTFYGDGPTVTTADLSHKDTAYTNEFLDLHTDTSYFSEPMGLQIFHLLHHNGDGGENSISDGFLSAQLLYDEDPHLYSVLASTPIIAQYSDDGNYFYSHTDVALSHNLFTNNLERVRFNPSDMGTVTNINPNMLTSFYKALVRFSSILEKQGKWIALKPGTILFLDNWRTLHGRREFTGERSMASVYVGRSDWQSKARTLGIIKI